MDPSKFIGHEDCYPIMNGGMETLIMISLGANILIITIIGKWNHPSLPLVHERKGGPWLKGRISTSFHWPMENKPKERYWRKLTVIFSKIVKLIFGFWIIFLDSKNKNIWNFVWMFPLRLVFQQNYAY